MPEESSNPSERRKYKRISKHFILTYYNPANPKVRHNASQVKNISVGGMCLVTAQKFDPGITLRVELKTPYFANLTRLDGKVLESIEKIKDVIYETRLEFIDPSENVKLILQKITDHFSNEGSF